MPQFDRALIVGASSGIGKALSLKLLKADTSVALVARRPSLTNEELRMVNSDAKQDGKNHATRAFVYQHDVTDFGKTASLFQQIIGDLGGLDLIIYSAGTSKPLDLHEYNFEKDLATCEVNLLGAFAWLDEAAKYFEEKKAGTIVGISSVAGERGRPENPPYFASKAAITSFLESLRNRLWKRGVKVITIKPGFVDTGLIRKQNELFWLISAERAAELIFRAIRRGNNTAYIPSRWRLVSIVMHTLPSFIYKRLSH